MQAPFKAATKPQAIVCDCFLTLYDAFIPNTALINYLAEQKKSGTQIFLVSTLPEARLAKVEKALEVAGLEKTEFNVNGQAIFDKEEIEAVLQAQGITTVAAVFDDEKPYGKTQSSYLPNIEIADAGYINPTDYWKQSKAAAAQAMLSMQPA